MFDFVSGRAHMVENIIFVIKIILGKVFHGKDIKNNTEVAIK